MLEGCAELIDKVGHYLEFFKRFTCLHLQFLADPQDGSQLLELTPAKQQPRASSAVESTAAGSTTAVWNYVNRDDCCRLETDRFVLTGRELIDSVAGRICGRVLEVVPGSNIYLLLTARKKKSSAYGLEDRLLMVFSLSDDSPKIVKARFFELPTFLDDKLLPRIHSLRISKLNELGQGLFSLLVQTSKTSVLALRLALSPDNLSFDSFIDSLQDSVRKGNYCVSETEKDIMEGNKLIDARNSAASFSFWCYQHHL